MAIPSGSACAKLILLGEHAVVYGQPAIAIPFSALRIRTTVEPNILGTPRTIHILAPELEIDSDLADLPEGHYFPLLLRLLFDHLELRQTPTCKIFVRSEIPFSAGLGSSAALAISVLRGMSAFLGHPLTLEETNILAYESERFFHGRPSGVDNTVIAYEKPVYFTKDREPEFLAPQRALIFLVADSGVRKSTSLTVADLAHRLEVEPGFVNPRLEQIGRLVHASREALVKGDLSVVGENMNEDQRLLAELDLSCPELDNLVSAAREAGAYGAKLTGGGRGGNMLALVDEDSIDQVRSALEVAGAVKVIRTVLKGE